MDAFDQFFKENRLRLDTEDFDADFLKQTESRFRQHRRKIFIRRMVVAASFVLILALVPAVWMKVENNQNNAHSTNTIHEVGLEKTESIYRLAIESKVEEIRKQQIPESYQNLFDEFIIQLQIIDKQYNLYKSEIEAHGYTDEIIAQLIYNYKLKLSVLKTLQTEMNKINNLSNQQKNEKINIQIHT